MRKVEIRASKVLNENYDGVKGYDVILFDREQYVTTLSFEDKEIADKVAAEWLEGTNVLFG